MRIARAITVEYSFFSKRYLDRSSPEDIDIEKICCDRCLESDGY